MTNHDVHSVSKPLDKPVQDMEINIIEADKSIAPSAAIENKPRVPGGLKGQIGVSDDFDEPMSEEELALWYDGPIFPEDDTHSD